MLFTAEPISAQEALQYGLLNYVTKDEKELEDKCKQLIEKIIVSPPNVVAMGKKAFYDHITKSFPEAYAIGEKTMVDNLQLKETKEGINAFANKRKPQWD